MSTKVRTASPYRRSPATVPYSIPRSSSPSGKVHLHGPAGTVVLFNLSVLHAATVRITPHERKTVQIYYGHRGGPVLSDCTMIPARLWRDHPDPEVRGFYGMMTSRTQQYAEGFG